MAMCGWPMSCSFRFTTSKLADVEKAWKHFELYEAECKALLEDMPCLRGTRLLLTVRAREGAVSRSGGLRSLLEVLAPVQHSRCARRDFGDRAGRSDRARAGAGRGNCESLGGSAERKILHRKTPTRLNLRARKNQAERKKNLLLWDKCKSDCDLRHICGL